MASSKKLILNVIADVKDAKAGLAEVGQGIKDLFKLQQGSGRDIANGALKAFDGVKGALEGIAPVASAVLDVAEKGIEMAQFAGQRQLLLRQVGDANLAALKSATQGLVDDQTLLQAAARGLRGDFALTTEQMQNVAAAAVTLHNEGFGPIPDIIQEITEKLSTGEVDGLKKYGISLGTTGTQAEKLGRAHQAMGLMATSANNKLTDSGTEVTKLLVRLKDAWDNVKVAIGAVVDVVATLTNAIVDEVVVVGDWIGEAGAWVATLGGLSDANDEVFTSVRGVKNELQLAAEQQQAMNQAAQIGIDFVRRLGDEYARVAENVRQLVGDETELEGRRRRFAQMVELNKWATAAEEERAKTARENAKKAREQADKDWKEFTTSLDKVMDHRLELVKNYEEAERHAAEMTLGVWGEVHSSILANIAERQEALGNALAPVANQNKVDPGIKRLQDMARETMNARKAFEQLRNSGVDSFMSLTEAAGTSFQAVVSGNQAAHDSMGEVFRKLLDQLGTEMQINALKYLAMGTAALFTNPAAAGGYFAAAGIFEAAALLAGVAERGVGAPAGQQAAAGGGAGGAAANSNTAGRDAATGSSGGGNVTIIHEYHVNGFIGDEARLARQMESSRRKAELSGTVRTSTVARRSA